jgi:peptidoglycan hydrolase CwlO-like protein
MDASLSDPRLHNRHLERLAARLGDVYGEIERLSLSIHRWQRQLDHIQDYVAARQNWIATAQTEIDELTAQAGVLEATYYSVDGDG